jgi:hypothetical protein
MADSKQVAPSVRPKPPNAGKGRKKGSLNKTTKSVKEALTLAFEQRGGVPALIAWAKQNETEFYRLWSKLIPVQVAGDPDQPITHAVAVTHKVLDPSGDR